MATVTDLNIGDAKNTRARSSFCTQVSILTKSVFRQKMINPKIGILEILMPLYPVLLVYIFKSVDVAKYEFTSTEAISFAPADSLLNNSYAEPLYPVVQWAAAPQNLYFAPDTVQSRSTASQICGKLGINSSLATWFQDGDALLKAGRIKNPEKDIPAEPRAGLILNPEENMWCPKVIRQNVVPQLDWGTVLGTVEAPRVGHR